MDNNQYYSEIYLWPLFEGKCFGSVSSSPWAIIIAYVYNKEKYIASTIYVEMKHEGSYLSSGTTKRIIQHVQNIIYNVFDQTEMAAI